MAQRQKLRLIGAEKMKRFAVEVEKQKPLAVAVAVAVAEKKMRLLPLV